MKAFITPSYTFTPGAAGVGTVDLSSIAGFDIKRLVAIINQTAGVIIYSTASETLKYTSVSSGVITLALDTSSMSASDVLQVIYEDPSAIPVSASSLPLPTGASTSAKQDLAKAVLDTIKTAIDTTNAKDFSTSAKQDLAKGVLDNILTKLNASLAVTGTFWQATQPVSIASAISTNSTPQTISGTITCTQKTVGTTAVRATVSGSAPSASRKKLLIKPSANNTGNIYIGSSSVTTSNGMQIVGPDRLEFIMDASDYYLISDTASQSVDIIEVV